MHRTIGLLVITIGLFVSGIASAAAQDRAEEIEFETADYGRVYVGASAVASWITRGEDEFTNSVVSTELGNSYGLAFTYGVRLRKYMSVEVDFEWLEGHETDLKTALGVFNDNLVYYSLGMVFAGRPINHPIFDPFISVGGGWTRVKLDNFDVTGDGFAFRFAIGSDFWVTDHIGVRVEGRYLLPVTSEIEDLDSVGPRIGLFYRF
jgi:opacity protein-like surface antigen